MDNRSKVKYSIIRYSPDEIRGEVLNVGVLLHDLENLKTKFSLLDSNSFKLKAFFENSIDINTYKSYKDVFEYYLNSINNNISGTVGTKTISSYYSEDFMLEIYNYHSNKKLFLSEPSFAFTKDFDLFFESIFSRYVRKEVYGNVISTISAKDNLKEKFDELKLIGKKIKTDKKISPIKELNDYKVRVDFSFKNGVWNYLQAVPRNSQQNTEWFSKMKIMSENLKSDEAKIHLIYSNDDLSHNKLATNYIDFLSSNNPTIETIDVDDVDSVNKLCNYIIDVGEDLDKQIV